MIQLKLFLYIIGGVLFLTACHKDNGDEKAPVPDELTIEPASLSLTVGESYQLVAKLNGVPLEGNKVRWGSNSDLVSVDSEGKVTAVSHNEFISGLYVSALIQGLYAKCPVTVYQEYDYKLRLILKDKGTADYSLNQPEKYLSAKAIERRQKRNIAIDDFDLPISKDYLKQIEKVGGEIVCQSKWLKTVCVQCGDERLIDEFKKLPFVEDVVMVWRGEREKQEQTVSSIRSSLNPINSSTNRSVSSYSSEAYGEAWRNIILHNGQILHERGFKGDGIDIAVIDAGFMNLLDNPTLNTMKIRGAKSFIYEDSNPYSMDEHGVWTTACMATNKPGYYIGTAPDANYWLLRSEDSSGDYPVEEDYWVSAIEYADSVGVDVVNTSLYYLTNERPFPSYEYEEMDGKTALPTRAANVAATKGIFIACGAGNHLSWVGTPADSPNVLSVGSVTTTGDIGHFTAFGMTVDGRMKPDVVALGTSACTIGIDGQVSFRSGTSYASPILCGLAACLLQAYPWLTNQQLLDILRKSADRYSAPELPYGNGIVDIRKAIDLIEAMPKK